MEQSIIKSVRQFINQKTFNTEKDVTEAYKRAKVTPLGQFQLRSTILTGDYPGKTVQRPLPEQRPGFLVNKLGIKLLTKLNSNLGYPIVNGNITKWASEIEDLGDFNDTVYGSVLLRPKRAITQVQYSNQLILNPNTDIEGSVEEDLINSVWELVQKSMFNGIYPSNTDEINGIEDYSDIVELELKASKQNIQAPVYLVSPEAAAKLKVMMNSVFPVWVNGEINGHPVYETNLLEGEKIIYGDFTRLLLGQFGGWDITVDNITQSHNGITKIIINSFWDWGLIDPEAMVFASTGETTEPEPEP